MSKIHKISDGVAQSITTIISDMKNNPSVLIGSEFWDLIGGE